jgi:hypothetical protein
MAWSWKVPSDTGKAELSCLMLTILRHKLLLERHNSLDSWKVPSDTGKAELACLMLTILRHKLLLERHNSLYSGHMGSTRPSEQSLATTGGRLCGKTSCIMSGPVTHAS